MEIRMNITCSPINTLKEIFLRVLYLAPIPFMLTACFLPVAAISTGNWQLSFAGVLCVSISLYWRSLGLKYWDFERLDDEFEGIVRYPGYAFELKDEIEQELDRMIAELESWDGSERNRPSSLLEVNSRHRNKAQNPNPWDN
jgi:hypothetical protein